MSIIRFTVLGEPAPKGSMKLMPIGRKYPYVVTNFRDLMRIAAVVPDNDARAKSWQKAIVHAAELACGGRLDLATAVGVELLFFVPPPQKIPADRDGLPIVRNDVDKLARLILDALTGVIYRDDAQVIDLLVRKRYAETPAKARVEVTVTPIAVNLSLFPPQPSQEPAHVHRQRRSRHAPELATAVDW